MVVPYLRMVYEGLLANGTKDYLDLYQQKKYLNLPEPLAESICAVINANGDERIDMDEFIEFFITVLMGTARQKMYIAFKCYDPHGQDIITSDQVKYLLSYVPKSFSRRFGMSINQHEMQQFEEQSEINTN